VRFPAWLALGLLLAGILVSAALAVEGDVDLKRQGGGTAPPPAVFPHWVHRIRFKCYVCHPAIFEMKAGANAITMDAIQEGKFCGTCHNGKIAWEVSFETCNRCHVEK
jgi:c(7)-type cytochrome triheme protein